MNISYLVVINYLHTYAVLEVITINFTHYRLLTIYHSLYYVNTHTQYIVYTFMKCPFCDSESTKVVDKRDNRDDSSTRRRRQCLRCSKRFTTYERIEKADLSIQKKDGSLEKFDTEKIRKGIRKAVDHEKITEEDIEIFIDEIEKYVFNKEDIVKSTEIGLMILEWLKTRDALAYIRFASVYKGFKGVNEIVDEIKSLENN